MQQKQRRRFLLTCTKNSLNSDPQNMFKLPLVGEASFFIYRMRNHRDTVGHT